MINPLLGGTQFCLRYLHQLTLFSVQKFAVRKQRIDKLVEILRRKSKTFTESANDLLPPRMDSLETISVVCENNLSSPQSSPPSG